ncbi:MAG: orotidine-5'-phosphate decarboxylase [Desulfovibrionaceae bacterium]
MHNKEKIIVALDMDFISALKIVDELGDCISIYKVGLEMFLSYGERILQELTKRKKYIFLDLKFYDIPNTVLQASRFAISYDNVLFFTLHAMGGRKMIEEVAMLSKNTLAKPVLVTVLTSFNEKEWEIVMPHSSIEESVLRMASLAHESGAAGVVCSPKEAMLIKKSTSHQFITICPGIRPLHTKTEDQERTLTPKEALDQGADYIVIGRPITQADSPVEATEQILMGI